MTIPIRLLIVDDEDVARKRLARLAGELADLEIAGECGSATEMFGLLEDLDVDVVLLDVRMPGLSGIEARARLDDGRPHVIFVTAHPEHAIEAFDVGAVDYVLKPVDLERLGRAVDRARTRLLPVPAPTEAEHLDRLAIQTNKGVRLIDPSEVTHALLENTLVTLHTITEIIVTELTLQDLLRRLPESHFERVHRRALLNLRHVERLEPLPTGGYTAWTRNGCRVEVSRQSARALRRRLGLRD